MPRRRTTPPPTARSAGPTRRSRHSEGRTGGPFSRRFQIIGARGGPGMMGTASRSRRRAPGDLATLGAKLDGLYRDFNQADAIVDPVNLVRRFTAPADREIAGFCAAALAFGRVASVNDSIETVFALMGPSPAAFTRTFNPRTHGAAFATFVHRWTRGPDIVALLWVLKQMLDR